MTIAANGNRDSMSRRNAAVLGRLSKDWTQSSERCSYGNVRDHKPLQGWSSSSTWNRGIRKEKLQLWGYYRQVLARIRECQADRDVRLNREPSAPQPTVFGGAKGQDHGDHCRLNWFLEKWWWQISRHVGRRDGIRRRTNGVNRRNLRLD